MTDDKNLVERLRGSVTVIIDAHGNRETFVAQGGIMLEAANAIERLTRERDEARAALAKARNDALEEAATWHDRESLMNRTEAGRRGRSESDYWHFDGRADQHQGYAAAIRTLKREPADD